MVRFLEVTWSNYVLDLLIVIIMLSLSLSCILLSAAKLRKTFESRLVHFGSILSSNEKNGRKCGFQDSRSLRQKMADRARLQMRIAEDPNDFDARRKIKQLDEEVSP